MLFLSMPASKLAPTDESFARKHNIDVDAVNAMTEEHDKVAVITAITSAGVYKTRQSLSVLQEELDMYGIAHS